MKKIISVLMAVVMCLAVAVSGFAATRESPEKQETYSMIWHRAMTDFGDVLGSVGGRDRTVFIDFNAGADGSALRFQFNNLDPKESELKAMTVFVRGKCYPVTYQGKRILKYREDSWSIPTRST